MNLESIGVYSAIMMVLCLPIHVYTMFSKLDLAESYLLRCSFITDIKHLFRNDIFEGRSKRLFAVTFVLIMPKLYYWRRLVDLDDIDSVPLKLKLWIVIPTLSGSIFCIIMMISGYFLLY